MESDQEAVCVSVSYSSVTLISRSPICVLLQKGTSCPGVKFYI